MSDFLSRRQWLGSAALAGAAGGLAWQANGNLGAQETAKAVAAKAATKGNIKQSNYPPIMRKLVEVGYQGYVGQEFIPTRDPLAGLTQAVKWCDV